MIVSPVLNIQENSVDTGIARFRSALHGELILPGDAHYETARRVWNAAIDRYPAIIARCVDAHDVQLAVEFARNQNLEIAVRGGGHSFPGLSTTDGGLVIDLSSMKNVIVNPQERYARAEPGVTLGELIDATEKYGLVTNTGTASDTGIAGLTLGGGIGWLMGKYGLTCDNVRSFDVVTADGQLVRVNANENSDLYWGLRGGGGNFGIVTSFEYQLHPLTSVLVGMVVHPISAMRAVLEFYREFIRETRDDLTTACVVFTNPDGSRCIGIVACYCGDLWEGEKVLAPLRNFGTPLLSRFEPMPYSGLFTLFGPPMPNQRGYYMKGSSVPNLSDGAVDALMDSAGKLTSSFSQIILFHVHGAAAWIGVSETAVPFREEHFQIMHLASWEGSAHEEHARWSRQSARALEPFASQHAYVNFLAAEENARVRAAYGSNYGRLVALKTKYDPDNMFHLNQNIKPNVHLARGKNNQISH